MSDPWLLACEGAATAGIGGLGAWALWPQHQALVSRELRFPADLSPEQVEGFLTHVAGTRRSPVILTVEATEGAMRFFLSAPKAVIASIAASLSGIAPEVRLDDASPEELPVTVASRLRWAGRWALLRTSDPEITVAGLLGALASVGHDERIRLVVRLHPSGAVGRPKAQTSRKSNAIDALHDGGVPREDLRALRLKFSLPLLRAEVVVGASASPDVRAAQLVERVIAALRSNSGQRGTPRVRRLHGTAAARALNSPARFPRLRSHTVLSARELVPLVGLPIQSPRVTGISYGVAPRLMPPHDLPRTGRVFARSNWPQAKQRALAQPATGGLQHTAIIGGTGSGKSALIANLVLQDVRAGRGALVVDAKGDLVDDLLRLIPPERQNDVVVLDPASGGAQPGLALFAPGKTHERDPELTADLILGTLRELFADAWGIRTSQYLRLGLLTLAQTRGATLPELPLLFSDGGFRRRALAEIDDPLLLAAWRRFDALSSANQATQLAPALTKLEELVGRRRVRVVVGQAFPRLHFGEVLAKGRIVLVRLPPGLLGASVTRLLAALVLWQFFSAVEARAALPSEQRRPFMAYIDEIAALGAMPLPIEDLLERARGLGVGLTLAPQTVSQLSRSVQDALLGNVGSLVSLRLSDQEAKKVAAELPGISAEQLQHLEQFEVALRLSLAPGRVTPTMTGKTLPPPDVISDADEVRRRSAERYGASIEDVDAAHAKRHGLVAKPAKPETATSDTGAIGTRRRSS